MLAPHIASATFETRARMATIAATNALDHHAGRRAPQCVNPEVYESDAYHERLAPTRSPATSP